MARLPTVGGDAGNWGEILNDYLLQSHDAEGSLRSNSVGAPQLKNQSVANAALADGTIAEAKLSSAVQTKLNAATTIANGSVTTSKLADGSVTNDKLAGAGVAEGVATAKAVAEDARKRGIDMPICAAVDAILHGGRSVASVVEELLSRDLRNENI